MEVRVAEQEVVGNRLSRLVLWSVGGVLHLMAKVDFLQHLVTSFLSFGGGSSEGPRSPDGSDEPPPGFGSGSSPSSCPSLESLCSSQLDSPLVATPSSVRRSNLPGAFTQDKEDWLRAALQALPSPTLRMALISDFWELEEAYGELRAWEVLKEELEMHRILVYHNVLGCQNCDLTQLPVVYCSQSRHHPAHSLHVCPMTQSCPCS